MSQGSTIKVHITGGPPWGFRLQGGGNTPISIAKIRRKSKAYNARLQEGDEIINVNGRDCRSLTRDVTMSYVDGAKDSLDLEVIRRDKNFNTVNTSTYSISNNNSAITPGKAATIQLVPSGAFQVPGRPATGGSIRQTTNIQTRSIPGERSQGQQTITRTVTQRVGDGDEKTSTTKEYRTFGTTPGGETTEKTIQTGMGKIPRASPAVFQPSKVVGNTKPAVWSPVAQPQQRQPQQRQPQPVRVGQKTTIHLQGSFDEPSQQDNRDLTDLIPNQSTKMPPSVQFSMRPSLAKPQSVPKWQPPTSSSAPAPQQETKRWSAPAKSNVGKEMTITFGGPGQPMKIPIGVAAPMSVVSSAPPLQESTLTKYSTRTVTTLQETIVDKDSSDDEPEVFTRRTTYETRSSNVSKPVSIMDDPSVILRQRFTDKPGDKKKGKMLRPKSFPGAALDEPDVPETDKMEACKTIADLLMFPKNKHAKGAKMFAKRRKRSAKYTLEAYGTRPEDEELPQQIGPKIPTKPAPQLSGAGRVPGMPPPAPPPPPPPPPTTEPVFIPKLGISITPTDFNINMKSKDKCEHKTVSPTMCGMLVADLKGASGRGASMFERRRKRSEKFVLTNEGNNSNASPEGKENDPPHKEVTLEFIARHGQEESQEPVVQPVQPQPPVNLRAKTPWEAAMESPVGSIDSAFNHVNKKAYTGISSPPSVDKPRPPAAWMTTSNMIPQIPAKPPVEPKIKPKFKADGPSSPSENGNAPSPPKFRPLFDARKSAAENSSKANFKDFNKKARGWSTSPQNSAENTPPSASPASVHSADLSMESPGLAGSLPTQPLKYSGGYNDFNRKPRSFTAGGSPPWSSPRQEPMESEEL